MSTALTRRPAVFLDRDGTLTEPRHYPRRPADLVLQPGLGPPLRRLAELGYALVLVTNQSGLARGFFTRRDLRKMHGHLAHLLRKVGVELDGIYVCPHHPDGKLTDLAVTCACRKPHSGMLLQAAHDLNLDLETSWMVGDTDSDIEAGQRARCRTAEVGRGEARALHQNPPTLRAATAALALATIATAEARNPRD